MVVADAYETCLRLARQHYENFPVASRLLPAVMRPPVAAVYAFARIADDFADEGDRSDDDRIALLEDWEARLRESASGTARREARPPSRSGAIGDAVFTALGDTIRRFDLPPQLLEDLLSAFRQDVTVRRYRTWDDLLDYCRRSANPVGRLVLAIAGVRSEQAASWSDAVCTALQLTNFWQDLERDWNKGRLYVPLSMLEAHGASERDLAHRRWTPAWRSALGDAASRTRALFDSGRPVVDSLTGRLRWELRATWLGGVRILDRLEQGDFDVFERRPTLGWRDAALIAWRTATWPTTPAAA